MGGHGTGSFNLKLIRIDTKPYNAYNYEHSMRTKFLDTLPIPVRTALRKLGSDIRDARRRRRIPMTILAQRASIHRMTLAKVEEGDPGVAVGTYATVLFVLGMAGRLAELADARFDQVGLALEEERLPKRIRSQGKSAWLPKTREKP